MAHLYDKFTLPYAMGVLGSMYDYAVNDCGYDIDIFTKYFTSTGYAQNFEICSPIAVTGVSGIELAQHIIEQVTLKTEFTPATQPIDKSPEYWAGWIIAQYQWETGYRFKDIFKKVKMSKIVQIYPIYHEMDVTQFNEYMNDKMSVQSETNLKKHRIWSKLSQEELSQKSGVSIRSIQMYEQRQNDINKAKVETLYKLSRVLLCSIEDLIEPVRFNH